MTREKQTPRDLRRARTRTLIQLGGLLEKSGLLNDFGIELGADLQKDLEMQKPVATLFWGLIELKEIVNSDEFNLELWAIKGQKALSS
jgi:conjugative transfer protein TraD